MTNDETLPDIEEAARAIADDEDRWVKKAEPVCWDVIELLLRSGGSQTRVAERVGVHSWTIKTRKTRVWRPMETEQQRDWLTAVLTRAMALRRAKLFQEPRDEDAAVCAWRGARVATPSVIRPRVSTDGPAGLLTMRANDTSPGFAEGV